MSLGLSAGAAQAAGSFKYEEAVGSGLAKELEAHGKGGLSFQQPYGLSFDASGDLLVADPLGIGGKESIIDKFAPGGELSAQLGEVSLKGSEYGRTAPVNDETGHIYVADSSGGEIVVLGAAGEQLSRWTGLETPEKAFSPSNCCYVYDAVDNSTSASKGDVYVMRGGAQASEVYVYKPKGEDKEEGELVRELQSPEGFQFQEQDGLAVSEANGDVYVVDAGHRVIDRFSASGEFEAAAQIKGPNAEGEEGNTFLRPTAVAVDGATGHVFVIDNGSTVYEFDSAGKLIGEISEAGPGEALGHSTGLAVAPAGPHAGELYLSEAAKKRIDVFAPPVEEPPAIAGEVISEVSADSAELAAEINPQGAATEYHLEYGRCATPTTCAESPFEARIPTSGEASLGFEDFTAHTTPATALTGLTPEATYHVRVIAKSTNGESSGERVFRTQGAPIPQLPDGRGYELVSPPDKHAGALLAIGELGVIQAAANGSAIAYLANAPTGASPEGASARVQVLSTRSSAGWSSKDLATPHEAATGCCAGTAPEYRFFSEDLSQAIVQPFGLFNAALSAEASEQGPYLRTLGGCESECFHPLVSGKAGFANVAEGIRFGEEAVCEGTSGNAATVCGPQFLETSADASHFVLRSAAPLEPGLPRKELYEWSEGRLELISRLAANGKGEELAAPSGPNKGEEPRLGSAFGLLHGTARRAISADGSRIVWESGGALYLRDMAKGQTLQLDAAEAACPEGECEGGAGRFQVASADGSRIYFTDAHRLSKDSGASSVAPQQPDLYECRIVEVAGKLACALTDLTPSEGGKGANVQGDVLGASEDGSVLYLVADGALGSGAGRGTCVNESAEAAQAPGATCNLLALEGGHARLVAVLSGEDVKVWTQSGESRPARVSPSGRYLTFLSARSLTGYDNRDAVSAKPDAEAYLYDNAGAGSLECASCDPSGGRPRGVEYGALVAKESEALPAVAEEWEVSGWVAALLPRTAATSFNSPTYQPRYLNDSGRLFFNSLDALVPQDVNGTGDVYEYEPTGVGSCSSPNAGPATPGCVGLISSGSSPEASSFLDASESGDDVFFLTAQQLTSNDIDAREDVYDAHVCTGSSPCITPPPSPPAPCSGETSCRSAQAPQPGVFSAPLSATYSGPGNPASPPPPPPVKPKPPTKAQLLAKALASCKKRYPHAKQRRASCERAAHKRYGTKKAARKSAKKARGAKDRKSARGRGR